MFGIVVWGQSLFVFGKSIQFRYRDLGKKLQVARSRLFGKPDMNVSIFNPDRVNRNCAFLHVQTLPGL